MDILSGERLATLTAATLEVRKPGTGSGSACKFYEVSLVYCDVYIYIYVRFSDEKFVFFVVIDICNFDLKRVRRFKSLIQYFCFSKLFLNVKLIAELS